MSVSRLALESAPNSSRVPTLARKASRLFETRRLEARVLGSARLTLPAFLSEPSLYHLAHVSHPFLDPHQIQSYLLINVTFNPNDILHVQHSVIVSVIVSPYLSPEIRLSSFLYFFLKLFKMLKFLFIYLNVLSNATSLMQF